MAHLLLFYQLWAFCSWFVMRGAGIMLISLTMLKQSKIYCRTQKISHGVKEAKRFKLKLTLIWSRKTIDKDNRRVNKAMLICKYSWNVIFRIWRSEKAGSLTEMSRLIIHLKIMLLKKKRRRSQNSTLLRINHLSEKYLIY